MSRPTSSPPRAALACLLLTALIVVTDVAVYRERTQFVGLLVAVPFLAAALAPPRLVVLMGVVAWLGGVLVGALAEDGDGAAQVIRLACIAGAVVAGVVTARARERREDAYASLRSAADAASLAILRPIPTTVGEGVRVAVRYVSAYEASRVGGDLYEVLETPFGVRVVVGDVRGKGLEAIRLASLTLGSFREAAYREPQLERVATAMDEAVRRDAADEDFVTALLVQFDPGPVRLLSCGHPLPLLVRGDEVREVEVPVGAPLGIARPGLSTTVPLEPRDRLLLYTDGAAEARRDGAFFPLSEAVRTALRTGTTLDEGLAELTARLSDWVGSAPGDDVAFLAVELPPLTAPRPAAAARSGAER